MAEVTRNATVHWEGDMQEAAETSTSLSSHAAEGLPVSLPARSAEQTGGQTSPEELIAAAHAGCYAMALSLVLTQAGNPPDSLDASAEVALDEASGGGLEIFRVDLNVRGRVPDWTPTASSRRRARRSRPVPYPTRCVATSRST